LFKIKDKRQKVAELNQCECHQLEGDEMDKMKRRGIQAEDQYWPTTIRHCPKGIYSWNSGFKKGADQIELRKAISKFSSEFWI
jgi:hypothetical protein